ncbi:MAG: NAD-dependent epimerase/dehydratase family protein [Chloroflexi bacterium]|nr:NAD-dependent epimerase/dehydratase family protein [Chloroflexota bacterium]
MRAFVTGATGFVGSHVAEELLRAGYIVRALVRPGSDVRALTGLDVERVSGSLSDKASLYEAMQGCDLLFHVAAFYSTREEDAAQMYAINVGGTKTILQVAMELGVQRVVYTSTIGTIGQPTDGTLADESVPFERWEESSHYARSKVLAEEAARAAFRAGLAVVIVNPCAPVGPRDHKPSSTGQRIVDYLNGRMPSYLEGGINFIAVRDVAVGHRLAAERGVAGERYILGHADGNLQREDFLRLMERVSGVPRPLANEGPVRWRRLFDGLWRRRRFTQDYRPPALTANPRKAIEELGLPQTPLEEAFAEAVAWYRANGYVRERR